MKTREDVITDLNKLAADHRQKYSDLVKLEGKIEALQEILAEQKAEVVPELELVK